MSLLKLLCFILLFVQMGYSFGRPVEEFRVKNISAGTNMHLLDTLSIDERFFRIVDIHGMPLDSAFFRLCPISATLFLSVPESMHADSLRVSYKVLPILLSRPIYLRNPRQVLEGGWFDNQRNQQTLINTPQSGLLDFPGIQSSGTISRGIAMGNMQDLSVRSEMTLQLSGNLADDVAIRAVISDQDIPFQADGTTRQLNEFDRVYIQVESPLARLTAGDFDLQQAQGHFLRINRRAQGAKGVYTSATHEGTFLANAQMSITAAGAISKGNFARNQIQGMEGNQGPYRLMGANQENFIMVLSGTERVFVDGQLLTRGSDQDYIIDYNTAEITFTPRMLISAQNRIIVEFEYANRHYARSMVYAAAHLQNQKNNFRLQVFSEQDHKFQSLFYELSNEQQRILQGAGDNMGGAFSWNIRNIGFHNDRVMYRMTDSLGVDTVFVLSTDPQMAVYQVGFTKMGEGRGNYRQILTASNGRAFQWVAPVNGQPQGTHEPIIQLVAPHRSQMITLEHTHRFSDLTHGSVEFGLSNNDLNLFSALDQENDLGFGLIARLAHTIPLGLQGDKPWNIGVNASHEFTSAFLKTIDRIRSVEFTRDWNIGELPGGRSGNFSTMEVQVHGLDFFTAGYNFQSLREGPGYKGFRNQLNMQYRRDRTVALFEGSFLSSSGFQQSRFYRHRAGITIPVLAWDVGFAHNREFNRVWKHPSDSLFASSNAFDDWRFFLRSAGDRPHQYELFYRIRNQQTPVGKEFSEESTANEIGFNYRWMADPNHSILVNATRRSVAFPHKEPEATLAGRLELASRWFGGAISTGLFYDAGTGVQRQREYVYMEVPAGQGVFAWVDYNANGLMELDEFELAQFPDQARFIRVFIPTEEFVRVFATGFTGNLSITPDVIWRQEGGVRRFLARFENRANIRVERQKLGGATFQNLNPLAFNLFDTMLVALNQQFRNTLSFNRRGQVFSADANFISSTSKALLSNGFETRRNVAFTVSPRVTLSRNWSFTMQAASRESQHSSEFFAGRNFSISEQSLNPMVSFQSDAFWRLSVFHRYTRHTLHGVGKGQRATVVDWGGEVRLSFATMGSLNGRLQISQIEFPFATNNPAAFQILQGLAPGTNSQLSIGWQQRLTTWMQLEFSYHARKSPAARAVHTGNVMIRAAF